MGNEDFGWQSDRLDLDAYLARTGYTGDLAPTLDTLRGLQRAHVTSIPFENLEIELGRPVLMGLDGIQDKLVRRRRGGYCFEHTWLFASVLEKLGFAFTALAARVSFGQPSLLPQTHAIVRVETEAGVHISDVGFGSGPLEPLPFEDGAESSQGGWAYRLRRLDTALGGVDGMEEWALNQNAGPDGWVQRHTFTLAPAFMVDYEMGNYFISTSPHSPFTGRVFAQVYAPDVHVTLNDRMLRTTRPDSVDDREIEPAELPGLLSGTFGIDLDGDDLARLVALLEDR